VTETAPGEIEAVWKTPLAAPAGVDLGPELPEACAPMGEPQVSAEGSAAVVRFRARCGDDTLVGARFGVRGLPESATEALLRLRLADGREFQAVLRPGAAEFFVPERQTPLDVAAGYLALGFRHILEGLDHLAFVLGLVLLVRDTRSLVWTVTAFTAGHSVTLSLAVLGFVGLPPALVELGIAASILLLALELARGETGSASWLRRAPWAVAGVFGLLHGFGFAGALAEVGLPQEEIPTALLSFNVGIELGQLAFVAAVLALRRALRPALRRTPAWLERVPAYGIGALAGYWCLDRAFALLGRVGGWLL
jgi:hydrogenase/urease accessory protein HupE